MAIPEKDNQVLTFCQTCGELKVKDVKEELQKLLTAEGIQENVCGICCTKVHVDPPKEIKVEKEIELVTVKTEVSGDEPNTCSAVIQPGVVGEALESVDNDRNQNEDSTTGRVKKRLAEKRTIKVRTKKVTPVLYADNDDVGKNVDEDDDSDEKRTIKVRTKKVTPVLYADNDDGGKNVDEDDDSDEKRTIKVRTKKVTPVLYADNDDVGKNVDEDDDSDANDPSYEPPEECSDDDEISKDAEILSDSENIASETQEAQGRRYTKYGTKGVHPKLLEMMSPATNPKCPYKCKFCDNKDFGQLLAFQKHLKTHTGQDPMAEPFYCEICGQSFRGRDLYTKHKFLHSLERPLKCPHKGCKSSFTAQGALNRHLKTHSDVKQFKCRHCGKRFRMKTEVKTHERYHTGDKQFRCQQCGKAFFTKQVLLDHQSIHTGEKPFQCSHCSYRCRLEKMLKVHQKIHSRKLYQCERCEHVFAHKFRLDKHRELNKCSPPKPPRPVSDSSTAAPDDENIDVSHITECLDSEIVALMATPRSKGKPFRCKHCKKKEFHNIGSFIKHVSTHMAEGYQKQKPFICPDCGVRWSSLNTLETHKVVHLVVRPFKCPHQDCNATFKSKEHVYLHNRGVHQKVKPFMCELCGSSFPSKGKLKLHAYSHTDEKPIQCDQCDKSFKYQAKLKRHINRVHNEGALFMCETCGKAFRNKEGLRGHIKIHTGEKPFACEICDYRCARRDNLKKHTKIHFKEKVSTQGTKIAAQINNSLVSADDVVYIRLEAV